MSSLATKLSQLVLRAPVSDPMSGFFMLRRSTFDRAVRNLSAMGFKILLDIIASLPKPPVLRELPYQFRNRIAGESKLDAGVLRDYLLLIFDKLVGHIVPVHFLLFAAVGALGIAAHLAVLRAGAADSGWPSRKRSLATACAILGNFVLNNIFTFRERRLRGWRFVCGLGHLRAHLRGGRRRQCRRGRPSCSTPPILPGGCRHRRRRDEPRLELRREFGHHVAAVVTTAHLRRSDQYSGWRPARSALAS